MKYYLVKLENGYQVLNIKPVGKNNVSEISAVHASYLINILDAICNSYQRDEL